jgi:hypothetical protein
MVIIPVHVLEKKDEIRKWVFLMGEGWHYA